MSYVKKVRVFLAYIFRIAIPLALIAGGAYMAFCLSQTRHTAERTEVKAKPTLVKFMTAEQMDHRTRVTGMGTVIPAKEIMVQPEITGRVIEVNSHLIPGGRFGKGDEMLRIDSRDYEIILEQSEAALEKAQFDLKVEEGRQTVAEREWNQLQSDISTTEAGRELALRMPHIKYFRSAFEAANSSVKQAKLNLERATIRAPFNALVLEESVDVGQIVSIQSRLAKIIGTDEYWVQVSLPVDRLPWISIPNGNGDLGSLVQIVHRSANDTLVKRQGRVIQLRGDLDSIGRMTRVLVSVQDPLGVKSNESNGLSLLIGAFVHVEISGKELNSVYQIPRSALRNGNRIWVMNENNLLEIRSTDIIWSSEDFVYLTEGLADGESIVTSRIPTPIEGMSLRVESKSQQIEPKREKPKAMAAVRPEV